MGFTPEETHYRLHFEDPNLDGLVVLARSLTVDAFEEIARNAHEVSEHAKSGNTGNAGASVSTLLDRFSEALISWNIDGRNGEPVPATRAGIGTLQLDFVLVIINAWMEAIAGVSPPLSKSLNDTETSLGLSSMMEA